jgi:hypothetical protein
VLLRPHNAFSSSDRPTLGLLLPLLLSLPLLLPWVEVSEGWGRACRAAQLRELRRRGACVLQPPSVPGVHRLSSAARIGHAHHSVKRAKPIIGREEALRRGGLAPVRDCLVPRRCAPEAALRGASSSASSSAASDRPTLGLLLPLLLSLPLLLPWIESSEGWGPARCRAAESCAARRLRAAAVIFAAAVLCRASSIEKTEDAGTQRVSKANFCHGLFARNCVLRELRGEECSKLRRLRAAAVIFAAAVLCRASSIEKTEDAGTQRVSKANFCHGLFARNCVLRELRGEECSKWAFFAFSGAGGLSVNK